MAIIKILFNLSRFFSKDLGIRGFYPPPAWLKRYWRSWDLKRRLHLYSLLVLGSDMSWVVSDDVACAETVSRITMAVGAKPSYIITGTWTLWDFLKRSRGWREVSEWNASAGDIIISPTGMGNGSIAGHVGLVSNGGRIVSSNSDTGKVDRVYNLLTWKMRYAKKGGFPVYFFRAVD